MSIPKGILVTDKWFEITNYAGNDMDTTSSFKASTNVDDANLGKVKYSPNLTNIISNFGNKKICTRETCVPYTDSRYFSIIDIFKHLSIRMDYFTSELYALSNCVKNCNLNPANNPTSCIVNAQSINGLQYCNNNLYGTNANPSAATNNFITYMNPSTREIKLTSLPKYRKTELTTITISKNGINSNYKIYPNEYFDLTRQYNYIKNLTDTLNELLIKYLSTNPSEQGVLSTRYRELVNLRAEMDAKLEELFGKSNTTNMQYSQYYDSTIYTSIFWTVLVTSLLFYTFRKI